MAVITISRQLGSQGTSVAKELKEILGYTYLDKTILEEKLVQEYGFKEKKFDQIDEKKPGFLDSFRPEKDLYLHCLKIAVYNAAKKDNCIIMGRGAQVLLRGIPGILRIRIIAPEEVRTRYLARREKYTTAYTRRLIKHSDHDRAGFHRFFFHVKWSDPLLYDFVINTAFHRSDEIAATIKNSLDLLNLDHKKAEKDKKLADLCLSQEVVDRILYKERIFVQLIDVTSDDGVVTLRGASFSEDTIERCAQVTREVPGVQDVINDIVYVQTTYGMP